MTTDLKSYPAYKDSGVEWLGKVPEHWVVRRIKTIFREKDERSDDGQGELLSLTRSRGLIPQTEATNRIASIEDLSNYKICRPDDLVMNRMQAWSGMFAVPSREGLVSPDYSVFELFCEAEVKYFEHLFKTSLLVEQFAQKSRGIGSGFNRLYPADFGSIPTIVPPLREQTAIVRFLDYADRRIRRYIRAKQKLIALLEEQKQAIIHQAVMGQIDVRTGRPYPAYKPSGVEWLGDVPEDWEVRRLKTLLRSVDRRSQNGKETLLSLRRDHGVVVYAEHFARPPQGRTLVGFKLVSSGQLVVNRMQANNGLVFCSRFNGLVSPDYSVFEMRKPMQMQFLSDLLRTSGYRAHFRRESTGLGTGNAGFLRLYDEKLLETRVFLPPEEEQILILKVLSEGMSKSNRIVQRQQQELQLIGEYRTRLIADVVTGKLDVREAAAKLPKEDATGDEEESAEEHPTKDDVAV